MVKIKKSAEAGAPVVSQEKQTASRVRRSGRSVAPARRTSRARATKTDSEEEVAVEAPEIRSFRHFLDEEARVPGKGGEYCHYSFAGREPLIEIVNTIDRVLGSEGKPVLTDSTISICGG